MIDFRFKHTLPDGSVVVPYAVCGDEAWVFGWDGPVKVGTTLLTPTTDPVTDKLPPLDDAAFRALILENRSRRDVLALTRQMKEDKKRASKLPKRLVRGEI
jgi:hypothetical protein